MLGEVQAQVEAYDPVSEQLQAKIKICKILGPRSKNDFEMMQFLLRLKLVLIHIYDLQDTDGFIFDLAGV